MIKIITIFRFFWHFCIQYIITKIYINKILKKYETKYNLYLGINDKKKYSYYYGTIVSSIITFIFSSQKDKYFTFKERYFIAISFIGCIYDDFYDNEELTESEINDLLTSPQYFIPKTLKEDIFLTYYNYLLENVKRKNEFKNAFLEINHWQILSNQQKQPHINKSTLEHISFGKGGSCFLLYISIFDKQQNKEIKNIFFKIGGLFQLGNDIFDVYKDWQQGIKTLPNTTVNIKEFTLFYEQKTIELIQEIKKCDSICSKKIFLASTLSIVCLPMVALNQLCDLQNGFPLWNDWEKIDRKNYICDMSLWKNKLKYVQIWNKFMKI